MEDELRCGACKQLFNNPVLLPCFHALCLNCAVHLQQPAAGNAPPPPAATAVGALPPPPPPAASSSSTASSSAENSGDNVAVGGGVGSSASSDTGGGGGGGASSASSTTSSGAGSSVAGSSAGDFQEVDKLSILSETDSGVVCNSRPNSYVGTPSSVLFPPCTAALSLACPSCLKVVYFDESGAHNLPKYRAMQSIVDKYGEARQMVIQCQLCEREPAAEATVMCEQCEVLYCDSCREACHPARGPLARHTLLGPRQGKAALRTKLSRGEAVCSDHAEEALSLYCLVCRAAVCALCLHDTRHAHHDVQAINAMCKAQKTELSQNLQQLSEKAKTTTEFIQRLKGMADKVNDNCSELESQVDAQVRALVLLLEERRAALLDFVRADRDLRLRALKDQVAQCTAKLQQTTGLIQFCIEALKETDPPAFLQIGSMLVTRVANADLTWYKDVATQARISPHADLTLDDQSARRAIQHLNFIQMKPAKEGEERRPAAPGAPAIIPEECSAENNSVTVAWQPPPTSCVQGYVLELDDGHGGDFRDVYCGKETICTVDGLHFNSMYNARVKAFNSSGEGEYSELIGLQTAEVAWFTFDPSLSPGLQFSADHCALSCPGYEHRVALGSVGFSRGVHYWEFSVDRYDSDTDPSFGVARLDVAKDQMLGKDDKGWAMYIDRQRSWFLHGDAHAGRTDGGIQTGATVGVLLDLDRHQLSFYVNEEPQGPIAFQELYGVFYPAVSVNRGVSVTLHTALDPPTDDT